MTPEPLDNLPPAVRTPADTVVAPIQAADPRGAAVIQDMIMAGAAVMQTDLNDNA